MKNSALSILLALSALLAGLIILVAHPDLTWHDQQRLGQIALFVLEFAGALLLGVMPSGSGLPWV
jgi:hypothetical protein